MTLYQRLISNHPLANISFLVVLALGALAYLSMPRQQDPEINFNFVIINTVLPGASPEDVERRVTAPLEDAIRTVSDVRFIASSSRENLSSITVRFRELDPRMFDKRINDLRREIQNKAAAELPQDALDPFVLEITTSNGFPTVVLALTGQADDETLRMQASRIRKDLERLSGIEQVASLGLRDPELQIDFDPFALAARGLSGTDVADAVAAWYRDVFSGRQRVGDVEWLIRAVGQSPDPAQLAALRLAARDGSGASVTLDEVASISRGRERASQRALFDGQPAVLLTVLKRANVSTPALLERVKRYQERQNALLAADGLQLQLADDQTVTTSAALAVMESNAWLSLLLVLGICWLFLGTGISLLVASGVVFSIAGTLWVLQGMGSSLNIQVFVGIVVVLGMLVDDAIVIVEDMYYRLQRGSDALQAAQDALASVFAPVTAGVLTTVAAFLPLVLLPGIVGQFLKVIPIVVVLGLLISLIEAMWILPAHVVGLRARPTREKRWPMLAQGLRDWGARVDAWRQDFTHWLRIRYTRALVFALRHAYVPIALTVILILATVLTLQSGRVRAEFFAFDPIRLFYVNVDLPPETPLDTTLAEAERVRKEVLRHIRPEELRAITVQAGLKYTEDDQLYGEQFGQLLVSLQPAAPGIRGSDEIAAALRGKVEHASALGKVTFTVISGGPPKGRDVSVKVLSDDPQQLRRAADAMLSIVRKLPGASDVADDDLSGRPQLVLRLDQDAISRAGLSPVQVARWIRLHGEGEIVTDIRDEGEKREIRVRAQPRSLSDIDDWLDVPVPLPAGGSVPLSSLVDDEESIGKNVVRRFKFKRAITIEADLSQDGLNTLQAVEAIRKAWSDERAKFPETDLDFSGQFEDIDESLNAMAGLFLLGMGLIYLILAAQTRSYWQPFLVLISVPIAFCGVVLGLAVNGFPLSLYTLYGTVALAGVAVNAAIVLHDAACERGKQGMSRTLAVVYAGRRRVVPIIMTTSTTIAGLFSLAFGIGGKSLIWGPVAASLFWGLLVSTVITLFVLPSLFRMAIPESRRL